MLDAEERSLMGFGCAIFLLWFVAFLVSLGVSGAIIYFLIQAANGNVF